MRKLKRFVLMLTTVGLIIDSSQSFAQSKKRGFERCYDMPGLEGQPPSYLWVVQDEKDPSLYHAEILHPNRNEILGTAKVHLGTGVTSWSDGITSYPCRFSLTLSNGNKKITLTLEQYLVHTDRNPAPEACARGEFNVDFDQGLFQSAMFTYEIDTPEGSVRLMSARNTRHGIGCPK